MTPLRKGSIDWVVLRVKEVDFLIVAASRVESLLYLIKISFDKSIGIDRVIGTIISVFRRGGTWRRIHSQGS